MSTVAPEDLGVASEVIDARKHASPDDPLALQAAFALTAMLVKVGELDPSELPED